MKEKIELEQVDSLDSTEYRVVRLTNRTEPVLGTVMSKSDVDKLLRNYKRVSVVVSLPKKKS